MKKRRNSFKKSSKETVRLIKTLYKEGMNASKIGRYLKVHRTTVLYWVKKLKDKKPKKNRCGKQVDIFCKIPYNKNI